MGATDGGRGAGRVGGCLNYGAPDEPIERVRAAYGDTNFARLCQLKRRYDPLNLFRFNHNIPTRCEVAPIEYREAFATASAARTSLLAAQIAAPALRGLAIASERQKSRLPTRPQLPSAPAMQPPARRGAGQLRR